MLYSVNISRKRHPKKEVENALQDAEDHNWRIEQSASRGHSWGTAYCPCGQHIRVIWSTPKNPGNHANQIRRAVNNCTKENKKEDYET